jgi:hypothetical protein
MSARIRADTLDLCAAADEQERSRVKALCAAVKLVRAVV